MTDSPKPDMPDMVQTKAKRTLSEDQLAKLKVAREKALKVKQQMKQNSDEEKIKHYESKIDRLKSRMPNAKPPEPKPSEQKEEAVQPVKEEVLVEQPSLDTPQPEQTVKHRPKSKKKPVVIYEQSDSESSDDNSNVVYIKKGKSRKPKDLPRAEPILPSQPTPAPPQVQREIVVNPNPFHRHNLMTHYM